MIFSNSLNMKLVCGFMKGSAPLWIVYILMLAKSAQSYFTPFLTAPVHSNAVPRPLNIWYSVNSEHEIAMQIQKQCSKGKKEQIWKQSSFISNQTAQTKSMRNIFAGVSSNWKEFSMNKNMLLFIFSNNKRLCVYSFAYSILCIY